MKEVSKGWPPQRLQEGMRLGQLHRNNQTDSRERPAHFKSQQMKTILFVLALAACTKQPGVFQVSKSVTYLRHVYDGKKQFVETKLVSRWCGVKGEELKYYEGINPKKEAMFCSDNSNDTLELRIEKDCRPD